MKAIMLGAGLGIVKMNDAESYPICLQQGQDGQRSMDITLRSLRAAGVDDIVFVGGFHLEKIIECYPSLRYYVNPRWRNTNTLETLFHAEQEFQDEVLLSFSDTVYPASVVAKLMSTEGDIVIVVDRDWRQRYNRRVFASLTDAEKVTVDRETGHVKRIGKRVPVDENLYGEFIGLALFRPHGVKVVRDKYHEIHARQPHDPFHESNSISEALLGDMLQELVDSGVSVKAVEIWGEWADLGAPEDMNQFVFGTKAETLERLQGLVSSAQICDQLRFDVNDWAASSEQWVRAIQRRFADSPVVVRSSTLNEDSSSNSLAGAYRSVLGVDTADTKAVRLAVDEVIATYPQGSGVLNGDKHQILVQPQVQNVVMSGVLLTRDLVTGAPYYIINYDDTSMRTDTVTSGSDSSTHTVVVYRQSQHENQDPRIARLITVADEIQGITGFDALDIEFAIPEEGHPYILQVRPITTDQRLKRVQDDDIRRELARAQDFVECRLQRNPHLLGDTTVLGVMPDWNPAEIIGTAPKPLALSLYQYLITDAAWSEARSLIGYKSTDPEPLLVALAGHPYIDVRTSFNSFVPADLNEGIAEKLVNHYVDRLRSNPELHDKIEFAIAITCLTFDYDQSAGELVEAGFTEEEVDRLRQSLLRLTQNIVFGQYHTIDIELGNIGKLASRREAVLRDSNHELPKRIALLLNDCIRYGTVPFSVLARYSFIATALLRSMVAQGVLSAAERDTFLRTIQTVAGQLVSDMSRVSEATCTREDFLEEYGHLRPGTYDILSPRYDEQPDVYLPKSKTPVVSKVAVNGDEAASDHGLLLSPGRREQLEELLAKAGLKGSVEQLIDFIQRSIKAREFAKFEFTKNISDAFKLIEQLGEQYGLSREDVSYLPISSIVRLSTDSPSVAIESELRYLAEAGRKRYQMTKAIRLPYLITEPRDIYEFELPDSQPNYITNQQVRTETSLISGSHSGRDLEGKIALIEIADPGFDWIFSYAVSGLITKFGGANSHMAIRAAEFGLPAAIGCGEKIFDRVVRARVVELNCAAGQIHVVQ